MASQEIPSAALSPPNCHESEPLSEHELCRSLSLETSSSRPKSLGFRANLGLDTMARRTLGIIMLMITVFLWTSSNFLASVRTTSTAFSTQTNHLSISLPIIPTPSHSSSPISMRPFSLCLCLRYCYASHTRRNITEGLFQP